MATLTTAVNSIATSWVVDALPTTHFIQVDDEIVEVEASFAATYDGSTGETEPNKLRVLRAALGTSAASHSGGATLAAVYGAGSSGGGGSLTLDNTVDPPAEVTTLIAAGATIDGAEGTLPDFPEPDSIFGHFFRGAFDPADGYLATLEPGDLWLDTSGGTEPYIQKTRNAANDGWVVGNRDPDSGSGWSIDLATGDMLLTAGPVSITLRVDGSIQIGDSGALVTLAADGSWGLNGAQWLEGLATGLIVHGLPTADPVVADAIWNDSGTLKVSAA